MARRRNAGFWLITALVVALGAAWWLTGPATRPGAVPAGVSARGVPPEAHPARDPTVARAPTFAAEPAPVDPAETAEAASSPEPWPEPGTCAVGGLVLLF